VKPRLLLALSVLASVVLLCQTQFFGNKLAVVLIRADIIAGALFMLLAIGAARQIYLRGQAKGHAAAHYEYKRYHDLERSLRHKYAAAHRRFIQRLDHEFKTPLSGIQLGLVNLEHQCSISPESPVIEAETLASIRAQVEYMISLVTDLRKLANLSELPPDFEPIVLSQVLTDTIQSVHDMHQNTDCHINLNIAEGPWPIPTITGDADLLKSAFYNLLDNALKFSHSGSTIQVRVTEDENSLIVQVIDTGVGIPENELSQLGEEFYRASTARDIPGTGLGLAWVQAIVLYHNGSMSIRSRLGEGTVVTLRFFLSS